MKVSTKVNPKTPRQRKVLGRYVVADSGICHGSLTFRGTRILVDDILVQVADGESWEAITRSWGGRVTAPMIADAIRVAHAALHGQGDSTAA